MSVTDLEKIELALLNGAEDLTNTTSAYNTIPEVHAVLNETKLTRDLLISTAKEFTEQHSDSIDRALTLFNDISLGITDNQERMTSLSRDITNIYFALRNAQAVEKNVPTYIKQLSLDLSDDGIVNHDLSNALVAESRILGIVNKTTNTTRNYTGLTLDTFTLADLTVSLVDTFGASDGFASAAGVNTGAAFFIESRIKNFLSRRKFEVVIDRKNKSEINQLDIKLKEAHLIEIHVSDDNVSYNSIFSEKIYIKDSVIPFAPTRARYVKLVIYKNSDLKNVLNKGAYVYRVDFEHLYLTKLNIEDKATFISSDIDPSIDNLNGIAIDTCDNYQDKKVKISYFVDFNKEEDWKELKPIGKLRDDKKTIKSYIKVNDFYTNKVIKINKDLAIRSNDKFEYQVTIDQDFIKSNQYRVMNKMIDVDNLTWKKDGGYYTIIGILNTAKEFLVGPTYPVYINGTPFLNQTVKLSAGTYRLKIHEESYAFVFNQFKYEVVSVSNVGLYTIKNKETGVSSTVSDTLYPYNLKINIESVFDFLFVEELIEGTDFVIEDVEGSNRIRTDILYPNLYIIYRLFQEDTTGITFRIKAEYESVDKTTIPYTSMLIVRCI